MVLFFRAIELGAYHADQAECHAGMIGEHGLEVGAMNAAQLHAREAFNGIVVDMVFEEHAIPESLAVMQHVENIFLAARGGSIGLDAPRAHDDDRLDGVAFMHDDGPAFMCRVARTGKQLALGIGGKVGKQTDVFHAR